MADGNPLAEGMAKGHCKKGLENILFRLACHSAHLHSQSSAYHRHECFMGMVLYACMCMLGVGGRSGKECTEPLRRYNLELRTDSEQVDSSSVCRNLGGLLQVMEWDLPPFI